MEFLVGGVSGACAVLFSNPLEVVKIRMQLQGELTPWGKHAVHYKNVFHAPFIIAKHDGLASLQNGLVSAIYYQLGYYGFRLGLYSIMEERGFLRDQKGELLFFRSILANGIAGSISGLIFSPFHMIKTQLQARCGKQLEFGHQHDHPGVLRGLVNIFKNKGFKALYVGSLESMPRVFIGCSSQVVSIAYAKEYLRKRGWEDNLFTTFVASMVGGVVVAVLITPLDLVIIRLYNQGYDAKGHGLLYRGYWDCTRKVFRSEGLYGFYKGLGACYIRLGPHTVLSFMFWDIFRDCLDLNNKETQS